jgi:hypothetical protein
MCADSTLLLRHFRCWFHINCFGPGCEIGKKIKRTQTSKTQKTEQEQTKKAKTKQPKQNKAK